MGVQKKQILLGFEENFGRGLYKSIYILDNEQKVEHLRHFDVAGGHGRLLDKLTLVG